MDVQLVRTRLAEAADVIDGLHCYNFVPDSTPFPAWVVGEVDVDFDLTYGRGMDGFDVICRAFVPRSDGAAGQAMLAALMSGSGEHSIKAALQAVKGEPGEPALGGACDDFQLRRIRGYRLYELGGVPCYGAEFTIHVIGPGD